MVIQMTVELLIGPKEGANCCSVIKQPAEELEAPETVFEIESGNKAVVLSGDEEIEVSYDAEEFGKEVVESVLKLTQDLEVEQEQIERLTNRVEEILVEQREIQTNVLLDSALEVEERIGGELSQESRAVASIRSVEGEFTERYVVERTGIPQSVVNRALSKTLAYGDVEIVDEQQPRTFRVVNPIE